MMSQTSKDELVAALRPRYHQANRIEKQRILDELIATTGYHRKYAIQVLNHPPRRRKRKRRAGQTKYTGPVRVALEQVWPRTGSELHLRQTPGAGPAAVHRGA